MTVPSSSGLSVCCLTSHDPTMVAAMLRLFRDHADEIVVAVDSRVDPRDLAPLLEAADTVVRFEHVGPPERSRPWLVQLCGHETVLMVDGDEVPSGALLGVLSELVADDAVVQWRVARRWCFPDERHWLAERPWWPDYQRRLVRRGPALDFDLGIHGGVRPALPARYVDEPLYHLACVLTTFASRRARTRAYEAARPGLVAVGGGPMNDTLYVPEHFATRPPNHTPVEDVAVLRSVLHASADRPARSPRSVGLPLVTADEVARHQPVDGLQAQGYRATLRVVELDRRTEPGNDTYVVVEVANEGPTPIPALDGPGVQVRVAARLVDRERLVPVVPWAFTALPCDVPPGQARRAEVLVRIPAQPGAHLLELDLVNERARWFGCVARSELLVATRWGRYAL